MVQTFVRPVNVAPANGTVTVYPVVNQPPPYSYPVVNQPPPYNQTATYPYNTTVYSTTPTAGYPQQPNNNQQHNSVLISGSIY